MPINISELRREAYRLWGIGEQPVIFNYPQAKFKPQSKFNFKIDFGSDKTSWPRVYAIADRGEEQPEVRVLMPIIAINTYPKFIIESKCWYDMPIHLHEQILNLIGGSQIEKRLTFWQKASRFLLGRNRESISLTPIEDYIYTAIYFNNQLGLWIDNSH